MTPEEYKRIVYKSKRWLMEYLLEMGKGEFSDAETMKGLFCVIGDEFKRLMREDEDFFREVESFCSKRRYLPEKQAFCRALMTKMVTSGNVHRLYAEKHPDYVLPAKYKSL